MVSSINNSSNKFGWRFVSALCGAAKYVFRKQLNASGCRRILSLIGWIGIAALNPAEGSAQTPAMQRAEMQTVEGKHIVLKSDSGSRESLLELVDAFDAAVPQWERFWQLTPGALDRWRVDAFVMSDPQRFRDSGDLPPDLRFPFGYAIDSNIWALRQKSDYYTRHLLLHEGVHALAIELFDGTGPSWFAEGLAEMLGVHHGTGKQVLVNVVPESRQAVPYWGRFKLLSQRREEHRIPTLDAVLQYPPDLKSDVESYGWSWVAAMLLTEYPDYRPAVLAEARNGSVRTVAFTSAFKRRLARQWPIVQARWRILTHTIDYGFDWSRERIDLAMSDKLWRGNTLENTIAADQGWQSVGVRFAPGMRVKISAEGRCSLDDDPKPWISEPPGVTIHYANERPIGQLLVCVLPNKTDEAQQLDPLMIQSVESDVELVIDKHCWLLFRVNDHLDDLGNNRGGYGVSIRR
ncbi:hypothetical protein [Stieleria mannarensis]|uniref:hypothetical protein n=1 Tax=Stieleria mannarensis TaxID=2755585 RepID=UPI00160044EC|nr:hypothetical protein [Rhodopirellula sp. JC639]